MDEFILGLLGLAVGIGMFAAMGHGLWLLLAAIFHAAFGSSSSKKPTPSRAGPSNADACPLCTVPMPFGSVSCAACGWPHSTISPQKRQALALAALRRTAKRFFGMNWLDAESYRRVEQAIDAPIMLSDEPVAPTEVSAPLVPAAAPESEVAPPEPRPQPQPLPQHAPHDDATERAAAFIAARREAQVGEALRHSAAREAASSPPPAKPFSKLFATFLEEKNIRWGELIGGLLIICSSIALVLSFWQQIAERPLLKFGLFNGVTAALFGIGLYVERRWRLPTTTHGILLIAVLLVPLNFLAIAAFTLIAPPTDALTLGGELASIGIFAGLTYLAARILVPSASWATAAAVIGCAAWQLVVRRFAGPENSATWLFALGLVPIAAYAGPVVYAVRRGSQAREFGETQANELFKIVGTTLFAAVMPLGLLLVKSEHFLAVLARLAPLVSLAGAPLLAVGLLMWRRLVEPEVLKERIAGTALATAGVGGMAAAVALGWPVPAGMLPTALINAAIFTWAALRSRIPAAHLPAALCTTAAYLVGVHVGLGNLSWTGSDVAAALQALISGTSGTALVVPTLLFLLPSVWAARRRESASVEPIIDAARWYAIASGLTAVASIGLLAGFSFLKDSDEFFATYIFALYAVGAVIAAAATGRSRLAYMGAALALCAVYQGLVYRFAELITLDNAAPYIFLSHALLCVLAACLLRRAGERWSTSVAVPLTHAAMLNSWFAVPTLFGMAVSGDLFEAALGTTWLAVVWGLIVVRTLSANWFALFQAAGFVAVAQWVHIALVRQDWYVAAVHYPPLLDPRALSLLGLAATAYCGVWLAVRLWLVRRGDFPQVARLVTADQTVDRAVAYALVLLVVGLAVYGSVPGICQELSIRRFTPPAPRFVPPLALYDWNHVPHESAFGARVWALLAGVAALITVGLWEQFRRRRLLALVVLGVAASLLIAARWETETAAASALRWTSAWAFLAMWLPLWFRREVAHFVDRLGWPQWPERRSGLTDFLFRAVLVATLAAPVLMTIGLVLDRYPGRPDSRYPLSGRELVETVANCFVAAVVGCGIAAVVHRAGRRFAQPAGEQWTSLGATILALLGAAPFVVMLLFWIALALQGAPVLGPDPTSFFAQSGLAISYAVPMLVVALTLVGHAVARRSAPLAFASSLVLNVAATAGYLLAMVPQGLQFDGALWLRLAQLNQTVTALFAIVWAGATLRSNRANGLENSSLASPPSVLLPTWLTKQVALAAAIAAAALMGSVVGLGVEMFDPAPTLPRAMADAWAWGALAVVLAAVGLYFRAGGGSISPAAWSCAALGIATLAALDTIPSDTGNLLAYHTLVAGWIAVAYGIFTAGVAAQRRQGRWFGPPRVVGRWSTFVAALTGAAALFGLACVALDAFIRHPRYPYRPFFVDLAVLVVLAALLAAWLASRWRLYLAALTLTGVAAITWLDLWGPWFYPGRRDDGTLMSLAALIAWALPTPLWLRIELHCIRPRLSAERPFGLPAWVRLPTLARTTALTSLVAVACFTLLGLAADMNGYPLEMPTGLTAAAAAVMLIAVAACLWDAEAKGAVASLYLAGLTAAGVVLDLFDLEPRMLVWTGTIFLAAYALGTSYLWSRRAGVIALCRRLGMPERYHEETSGQHWLIPANYTLALFVVVPAYWAVMSLEFVALRISAAHAVAAAAVSVGLLARGERRTSLQRRALELGALAAVALAWACIEPESAGEFLNRAVLATSALAGVVALYGIGFTKTLRTENEWTAAATRLVPKLIVVAGLTLVVVLSAEAYEFWVYDGIVEISAPAVVAVIAALVGLCVAALIAALVPGRDPLGLSERGRTAYVYAAEAILALLFLHVRLTMPWLFHGFFLRYWPVIIMLLAFAGVGLSELFRRKRQAVLSEPLERTGALLPLLPVFGFWVTETGVHYSLLLLAVGGLYAALAVLRKSFGFGILATLAANGGLWYFLEQQAGLGWLEHPQLWLIPPALCVLVAGHLNRRRMKPEQAVGLRYGAAATIYVSSTADIFLNGVAEAPYLPLVLGALALVGIFAGIALRIRAFLYLGTTFLLLALATIIWHAGYNLDRTWIFYVTGIVVGVLIIALFAVFEKKRQEILHVVERLREWD